MQTLDLAGNQLQLLPDKAIYIENLEILLVSDVHLGKSETFQQFGIPIPNQVNQTTLDRLTRLCQTYQPKQLIILGDLFHSRAALVEEVLGPWQRFIATISAEVLLIVGNHDRRLIPALEALPISYTTEPIQVNSLIFSHEPLAQQAGWTICGHVHPCVRLTSKLDNLRLPCFYLQTSSKLLILPSFGEFTGGFEVSPQAGTTAYVVVENSVIALSA